MKNIYSYYLSFFIILYSAIPLISQGIEYNMLLPVSVMADAGASVALTKNIESSLYNPAGLVYSEGKTEALMTYSRLWDASQHYISASIKIPIYNMALGISYIDSADQIIPIRTSNPDIVGSFNYNYSLIYLNAAYPVTESFFIGIKGKTLYQTIYNYNAWGYGMDLGILYRSKDPYKTTTDTFSSLINKLSAGLFIRNAIPLTIKLAEQTDEYALDINLGLAYTLPKIWQLYIDPVLNFNFNENNLEEVNSGVQINVYKILTLFSGYQFNRKRIGIGSRIDFKNIEAGYAVSIFEVENINAIDMKVRF